MKNFKRSIAALAVATTLGLSANVYADNSTGSVKGSITASNASSYTITIINPETGYQREVALSADGAYRFSKLPTGTYNVVVKRSGTVVAEDKVSVTLGGNISANFDLGDFNPEVITVTGGRISAVDVSSMDSGLVLGESEIDKMPIARNLTSVAMLAPGVVLGDSKFSGAGVGFASFGGSSVAENSCYINGLEVTNTRQGLGCGSVPFEFYKEFQVKTGGYSAMFGRATGGVINANTKSGTNEWEFAATASIQPDALQSEGKISKGADGRVFRDTRNNTLSESEFTLSASGPLIEDTLFVYALINPRNTSQEFTEFDGSDQSVGVTEFRERESSGSDNLFWGGKVDWNINDDHQLSYFTYSNENTAIDNVYSYDANTSKIGSELKDSVVRQRGGEAWSLSYTGYITDDLTLTALTGSIKTQYATNVSNVDCPSVSDGRSGVVNAVGCGSGGRIGENFDENEQTRLDIEYVIGDHTITAGYDYQKRSSTNRIDRMAGDHAWTYDTLAPTGSLTGDGIDYTNETGADQYYVSDRIFIGGGDFYSDLSAFYIEDQWQVTDDLVVNLGLRRDEFDSYAVGGGLLTSFTTDLAPRLGFSWDVNGDGDSKVYATWGHYYLPVANNTVYRVGSGISDTTAYYTFTGIDTATGSPTGIQPITGNLADSTSTSSPSVAPSNAVFQAEEADPFAKAELIVGYEQVLTDSLSLALRGTYRTLESGLDDYCGKYSYPHCVMLNPGEASTWYKDGMYWNGSDWEETNEVTDGVADTGSRRTHTVAEIGLPEADNKYTAIQTTLNYNEDNLSLTAIYTWSRSTGNFEGAVKSDIGQADAGLTQDFDFAALMDGADGYQANDRRHVLKMFGSYAYTDALTFGFNFTASSGRPLSKYGKGHPSDDPNLFGGWGDFFYTYNGCNVTVATGESCPNAEKDYTFNPRGTAGRTDWTYNVDLSASYAFEVSGVDMLATVNVFNVLDSQEVTSQNEHYESSEGTLNNWYGAAYSWQAPRTVRLGIEARF